MGTSQESEATGVGGATVVKERSTQVMKHPVVKQYLKFYNQLGPRSGRGRNVVKYGRSRDGKFRWATVRSERDRLDDLLHPARVEKEYRQSLIYLANNGTAQDRHNANYLLARLFFSPSEWPCADEIISGESGYDHLVWNHQGSGAYGIGQARPRSKMLAYGADAYENPWTQLKWFRAYAEGRYGSVCAASAHWTASVSW